MCLQYVGWMFNTESGNQGHLVEAGGCAVAWFEEMVQAIAYIEMSARLATATARAEAAETKLARALQENDALVAQHNEMDERLAAATARAEAAEAKLAAVQHYAPYYAAVTAQGDAPETNPDEFAEMQGEVQS